MISRDAIYDWLQELVAASAVDAPLADAVLFPNLKGSIDETQKVIRVDCWAGEFTLTEEPEREERNVDFVIQCVVTPDEGSDELVQLDAAKEMSFQMVRTIFREMAPSGLAGVCQAYADEWEQGDPSFGASNRGATYLYGKVNQ
jgi:hypothetical protein